MSSENEIILSSFWTVSSLFSVFFFVSLISQSDSFDYRYSNIIRASIATAINKKREKESVSAHTFKKNERLHYCSHFICEYGAALWKFFFFRLNRRLLRVDFCVIILHCAEPNGVQINVRHKFKSLVIFYRHPFEPMNISVCGCHFRKTAFPFVYFPCLRFYFACNHSLGLILSHSHLIFINLLSIYIMVPWKILPTHWRSQFV